MGNVFRVINSNGDIEITMYRKANAVFKTNEYNETDNICTYKETINIFNLLQENYELKSQLKGTTHCYDEEEHEKLKKQLEEKENIACNWKDSCLENAGKIEELETQQKEFIEYLEYMLDDENDIFSVVRVKDVLQKYKSIIGDDK